MHCSKDDILKAKPIGTLSERLLEDDINDIRKTIHRLTVALVSPCAYCITICTDPCEPNPVCCMKHGKHSPMMVNVDTCLECTLYKHYQPATQLPEQHS
jgi:hypothetical protein